MFFWSANLMGGCRQSLDAAQLAADVRWATARAGARLTPAQRARAKRLEQQVSVLRAVRLPSAWWREFLTIRAWRVGAVLEEDTATVVAHVRHALAGRRRRVG